MKRAFRAVSTCNADGWDLYGARMASSFEIQWPAHVRLTLYCEGFAPPPWMNVEMRDLPHWLAKFKFRHDGNPRAHGRGGRSYNFKFDAIKFAHKTAAVIDAAERRDCDVLIWIDGDTAFHAPVDQDFIEGLMPRDCAVAWLDRVGNYPECGFYALNLRHAALPKIIATWRALYETGQVFDLAEWHDSFVFQQVVEAVGAPVHSLSGDARTTSHPAINGPLGAILDHLKGGRKQEGRSRAGDLKIRRREAYWR
jgi:hypothetical protein